MENLRLQLVQSFQALVRWLEKDRKLLHFIPGREEWSVLQVIEHITSCNAYLLEMMENECPAGGTAGSDAGEITGVRGNFSWPHPGRIRPSDQMSEERMRKIVQEQFADCLQMERQLRNEEVLRQGEPGKSRMAQCLLFLSLHINRHLGQMERIETSYSAAASRKKSSAGKPARRVNK